MMYRRQLVSRPRMRNRAAAAIVLAMLTAALVSMAAIAILHASQRQGLRARALEDATRGDHQARGMAELAINTLRQNAGFRGTLYNPTKGNSSAYAVVTQLPSGLLQVDTYANSDAAVSAFSVTVDPSQLLSKAPSRD